MSLSVKLEFFRLFVHIVLNVFVKVEGFMLELRALLSP